MSSLKRKRRRPHTGYWVWVIPSLTEWYRTNNNYLTLLEENLNHGGKKTKLINMGIVATGPKDYLVLLAKEGLELKPDMVLVSFFIGNESYATSITLRWR